MDVSKKSLIGYADIYYSCRLSDSYSHSKPRKDECRHTLSSRRANSGIEAESSPLLTVVVGYQDAMLSERSVTRAVATLVLENNNDEVNETVEGVFAPGEAASSSSDDKADILSETAVLPVVPSSSAFSDTAERGRCDFVSTSFDSNKDSESEDADAKF